MRLFAWCLLLPAVADEVEVEWTIVSTCIEAAVGRPYACNDGYLSCSGARVARIEGATEASCKAGCISHPLCNAVFYITDAASPNVCLLYESCDPDTLRESTYLGSAYMQTPVQVFYPETLWGRLLAADLVASERLLTDASADDIAERDDIGDTMVHYTVKSGQFELLEMVLDAGADIEAQDQMGCTALTLATAAGYLEVVRLLLDRGANTEVEDVDGHKPIFHAATFGYYQIVEALLDAGATFEDRDIRNFSPLSIAVFHRQIGLANLLLSRGADPNILNEPVPGFNGTLWVEALCENDLPTAEYPAGGCERHLLIDEYSLRDILVGVPGMIDLLEDAILTWTAPT